MGGGRSSTPIDLLMYEAGGGGAVMAGKPLKKENAPIYARNKENEYRIRLIAARSGLGLTRQEMADVLLTPVQTLIQWEIGRNRTPGIAVAAAELLVDKARNSLLVQSRSGSRR